MYIYMVLQLQKLGPISLVHIGSIHYQSYIDGGLSDLLECCWPLNF